MILDKGGTGIALIAPPPQPKEVYDKLNARMAECKNFSGKTAPKLHGDFEILEGGLQRGYGILVR